MTNHEKILKDLSISQSTADSIAGRIGLPTEATELLLKQLAARKLIESSPLGTTHLTIYRLTSNNTIPCSTSPQPVKNSKNSPPPQTTSPAPAKSTSAKKP